MDILLAIHISAGTIALVSAAFLADATSMTSSRWRGSRCTASRPGPTQRNAQSTPIRRSKETKDPNRMHAAGLSLNVEYLSISHLSIGICDTESWESVGSLLVVAMLAREEGDFFKPLLPLICLKGALSNFELHNSDVM